MELKSKTRIKKFLILEAAAATKTVDNHLLRHAIMHMP
jgi:hypothetical protein